MFLDIPMLLFACIDLIKNFGLFDVGSSGFFHFSCLCRSCNCYQWVFSLLQVMNIIVKLQSSRTWFYRLLLDCFNSSFFNCTKSPAILFSSFLILQADWKSMTFSPPLPDYKSEMSDMPQLVQQTEMCLSNHFLIRTIFSDFVENSF